MQQYKNKKKKKRISTNTVVKAIPCCGTTSTFSWSWSGLVSTSITYTDELVTTTAWFSLTNNCSVTSNGSSSLINYGNKNKTLRWTRITNHECTSFVQDIPSTKKIKKSPFKYFIWNYLFLSQLTLPLTWMVVIVTIKRGT